MNTQLHAGDPDGENEPAAAHGESKPALMRCVAGAGHRADAGRVATRTIATHRRAGGGHFHHAWHELREHADRGLATAEYAIATIAAAGFAGLLIVVLKSGTVRTLLEGIVQSALNV